MLQPYRQVQGFFSLSQPHWGIYTGALVLICIRKKLDGDIFHPPHSPILRQMLMSPSVSPDIKPCVDTERHPCIVKLEEKCDDQLNLYENTDIQTLNVSAPCVFNHRTDVYLISHGHSQSYPWRTDHRTVSWKPCLITWFMKIIENASFGLLSLPPQAKQLFPTPSGWCHFTN